MKTILSGTKISIFCFLFFILFLPPPQFAQHRHYSQIGILHRFELSNSLFPDSSRAQGHLYNEQHYPANIHYNDSTVLVFVPDFVSLENEFDIIVYFHGWNNNVDSVLARFNLIEQLFDSKRPAILIMPEGPKNAPDSFGGKLEEAGRFKLLIEEILAKLVKGEYQSENYNYILAGHSGAYRVMSYILLRGGLTENIKEVYLFDGLYADVEKYSYWLNHFNGRFINIYTPGGGTKYESENLMVCLDAWGMPYSFIEGDAFSNEQLTPNRITFIASKLEHNEVVSTQNQFKWFLQTGLSTIKEN